MSTRSLNRPLLTKYNFPSEPADSEVVRGAGVGAGGGPEAGPQGGHRPGDRGGVGGGQDGRGSQPLLRAQHQARQNQGGYFSTVLERIFF